MPARDLSLLVDAARECGKIATKYSGETAKRWDKPGDAGPVTEADLAVNAMLERDLLTARPDYGWLSEETEDNTARLSVKRVFIIDPIDGTRSFIEGSNTWAHSLAIAENGVVIAAVVFLPLLDKMYTAAQGQGAHLNGAPIRASQRRDLDGATLLAARPIFEPKHWQGEMPNLERVFRPSLAYRLSLVAEGRYDAMLTLRDSWEWDIAAGDLIAREAGAKTSNSAGLDLRYNNPHPALSGVITAGPNIHANLQAALRPKQ